MPYHSLGRLRSRARKVTKISHAATLKGCESITDEKH
jgi:hypothetical protein